MYGTREENGGARRILEQVKFKATNLSSGNSFVFSVNLFCIYYHVAIEYHNNNSCISLY